MLPFDVAASGEFRHEAFLYADLKEFLTGTTAFVTGALEIGEAILVAVVEPRASLLKKALGVAARHVEFLDMAAVGRNPARIIPAWQDWVDRQVRAGQAFRGIGEPIWAGRSAAEVVECQHHEQLLNTAFDDGPGWWLLCPYNVADLDASVIGRAHDTHPSVVSTKERSGSLSYPHPELSFEAMFGEPLTEPPSTAVEFRYRQASLAGLRARVEAFTEPILGVNGAQHVVLVVNELATNSVKYGGGAGVLRMWHEDDAVVCQTDDRGVITDPLVGRRRPSLAVKGKAGLWMANQLCDLLQIRSAPEAGTTVRARLSGATWA